MFEKTVHQCPRCQYVIRDELEDTEVFDCPVCQGHFRVMSDEATGAVVFVQEHRKELPEPLNLPKGSIRAVVALVLALTCWAMVLTGRGAPSCLLSLLLTVIGYYFGFRTASGSSAGGGIVSATRPVAPLFVPAGGVRKILIAGFLVSGLVLYFSGRLSQTAYMEFYVILSALIVGYVWAKAFPGDRAGSAGLAFNHLKGFAVLVAAATLTVLLLGVSAGAAPLAGIVLCAMISFYYGSRC